MTPKDIKKIQICRTAIDKYRADKTKLVKEEGRIGTVINGEVINVKSEPERTKLTLALNQVMKEQGFVDEKGEGRVSVFSTWYNNLKLELFKECYPVIGKCDWCGETSFKDQNCLTAPEVYPQYPMEAGKNCKYEAIVTGTWVVDDYVYFLFMNRFFGKVFIKNTNIPESICPPEHGFHVDIKNCKELPKEIDLGWRV
jgi:hypothetical protein